MLKPIKARLNFRKLTLGVLLGAYGAFVMVVCWSDFSYYQSLPKEPDPDTGRVHRVVVSHGSVRYGTETENRYRETIKEALPIAILCFFAALILRPKWNEPRVEKREDLGG